MSFANLLTEHRPAIVKRWLDLIVDSYPPETARFLRREEDSFRNPVGATLREATGAIFAALLAGAEPAGLEGALVEIIKIRAVQGLDPARALDFVFLLKRAVREQVIEKVNSGGLWTDLLAFESRVDQAALVAFAVYVNRREQVHAIRTKEIRAQSERLMARLERIYGRPVDGPPDEGVPGALPRN